MGLRQCNKCGKEYKPQWDGSKLCVHCARNKATALKLLIAKVIRK